MNEEIKEIYLSDLEWTKTHDNMGGVMGNIVFKDVMSYEEYQKLFKTTYFVLCDKDYITNLQEENEYLKLNNPEMNIEHFRIINENKRKIDNLRKQNKELLKKSYSDDVRIAKAVEYINKNKHLSMFADCREPEEEWNYDLEINPRELLNILQNGSENND